MQEVLIWATNTVDLNYGDLAVCTITASRLPQINDVEDVVPDGAGGLFDLKIDEDTYENGGSGYGDNGEAGFENVTVGIQSVSEVAHVGTSLDD